MLNLVENTAAIAAAYLGANRVDAQDIPGLLQSIYGALSTTDKPPPVKVELKPAVPISKSVYPDYIVCLEDGKKLKMLKRHLRTSFNLTPEEYRAKWGLPRDYPMTAPNYATVRSGLARQNGLGRNPRT